MVRRADSVPVPHAGIQALAPVIFIPFGKGKQCNMACLLDRGRHDSLVPRTRASLPARADLAIFIDITSEQIGLLVIDQQRLICTELAEFGLGDISSFTATFTTL